MKKFDKALNEAIANSSIEQNPLNQEEIDIIKKAVETANTTEKSFFTSLYEQTQQLKNEKQRDKSR